MTSRQRARGKGGDWVAYSYLVAVFVNGSPFRKSNGSAFAVFSPDLVTTFALEALASDRSFLAPHATCRVSARSLHVNVI